jgi:hypothetical protein
MTGGKGERDLGGTAAASVISGHDAAEGGVADRITVVLLGVLRAGTLALGAAQTTGSDRLLHPQLAMAALLALAAESMLVFGVAVVRLRHGITPAMDQRTALLETAAGVAGLLVVAYATPRSLRVTPTFWIETYTVISAVVIAACTRRATVGAAGALCLTVAYLVSVFVVAPEQMQLSSAERATAWTNAISYLPFFAIGAIGFALLRSVVGQTDGLRRLLGRLSEERARVGAAKEAYDIGHDIPKALLREVRRGKMTAGELRPWAEKYRADLSTALSRDDRPPVSLHDELDALGRAFASATALQVDLQALGETPTGLPTLLIAEAARELLNNASFHAYGFPVTLTARSTTERIEVTVHNDGPGVNPARLESTWARKQNTLHQLQVAGGIYEVRSSAGDSSAGTTVTLTWPAPGSAVRGRNAPDAHAARAPVS